MSGYNGWKNYETWCIKLWMDNSQGDYDFWREEAQKAWDEAGGHQHWSRSEEARFNLADTLKDHHEEAKPELEGPWSDMLSAALSEVDWDEIADNLLQDVEIEEAEEGEEAEKYESA